MDNKKYDRHKENSNTALRGRGRNAKGWHGMRRLSVPVLAIGMMLAVTGCGSDSQTAGSRLSTGNAVDKVLSQKTSEQTIQNDIENTDEQITQSGSENTSEQTIQSGTENTSEQTVQNDSATTAEPTYGQVVTGDSSVIAQYRSEGVDVDLTLMSSDLVYATVYQMMSKPEEYVGKTIKMKGTYNPTYYPITEKYYNYCLIADAAACCSQGLEFELSGGRTYPDDYPADQSEIVVTGVFEIYTEEAGQTFYYCRLRDAEYELADAAE